MTRLRPLLLVLFITSASFAADPTDKPKPAPRPQPPQRINVVKTDGKIVSGLLTETDHFGLKLKPATGDELMVSWAEVKSTSNSMTRQTWLEQFKKLNAEKLCQKCKGEAQQPCETCKGTGIDPAQAKDCATCKGTGSAGKCPTQGCVEGKLDCPRPCIKLTRGVWKDEGGTKWQSIRGGGGTGKVSEHHVGEIIVVTSAGIESKGPCPTCGGTTKIEDPACKGKGHKLCKDCQGNGVLGPPDPACDHGKVKCEDCKGTGLQPS